MQKYTVYPFGDYSLNQGCSTRRGFKIITIIHVLISFIKYIRINLLRKSYTEKFYSYQTGVGIYPKYVCKHLLLRIFVQKTNKHLKKSYDSILKALFSSSGKTLCSFMKSKPCFRGGSKGRQATPRVIQTTGAFTNPQKLQKLISEL